MGKFLESIESRRERPEAIAHRAALRLSSSPCIAFVSEAGDDSFFYSAIISRLSIRRPIEYFHANGRANVIGTLKILQKLGKLHQAYGVIDRDLNFEDPSELLEGHCLVLDVYSYELYFADRSTLISIGLRYFSVETGSSLGIEWSDMVTNFLETISKSFASEMAVALWCRNNSKNCNLGQAKIKELLPIDGLGQVTNANATTDAFIAHTQADCAIMTSTDESEYLALILLKDWRTWFRGHYFWTLFCALLEAFRLKIDAFLATHRQPRRRSRTPLTERHVLEGAISFVVMPKLLCTFFLDNLVNKT